MKNNRLEIPGLLLIGSAGRNSGKTEFATRVISKFTNQIVATKATAIDKVDGTCPRGGEGCGVCSSLKGNYMLTEELISDGPKDTCRLLKAGAERVYWLRVLKTCMQDGATHLKEAVGKTPWLCETNSLASAVSPDLFLMVKPVDSDQFKASAEQVKHLADLTILSNAEESTFDLDFDRLTISNGRWRLRSEATAIILAGGKSKRMNQDKAMLPIEGIPMAQNIYHQLVPSFDEVFLSTREANCYRDLGIPVIPDQTPEMGPLMGIASSLEASSNEINFITACDTPDINHMAIREMLREIHDCVAVIPMTDDGLLQPLFAVYRKSLAPIALGLLSNGKRKIRELFDHCRVKYIACPHSIENRNLNTMAEYQSYLSKEQ